MENPERVTYFAATDSRGKYIPFGIKSKDRDRHMYVIGKTGMGKSTLLENMAIQDIRNGEGLVFLDPHGKSVETLLDYIPEERIKDVVYFAPFDMENPIAFNVMEDVGYDKRHLVVSGLMATFKKIWEDAWSARMEYILTNTLLALLEYPDATLLGVNRMYTDKLYRQKVVDNVKDPVVKDFWTKEFANYGDRYTQEATPAIQNKIGQFTGNPLIRNIIGQSKSSFDIRTMMDEKKILIINLSKGLVGETNMRLLGSMLTTRIFLAAMSRAGANSAEMQKLPHFYFYVDEFQNFANETFAEILSESRKYKLNLIITNQYIEQMEEEVRDAVFGNVGTTVVFRVGPFDAEVLEPMFMPKFTKEDIGSLSKFQIYMTLMIDGVGSAPFSAVTIPSIEAPKVSYREQIIETSRKQFATPRGGIESAIMEELSDSLAAEAPFDARMKKKPVPRAPVQQAPILQKAPPPAPLPIAPRPPTPRPTHQESREIVPRPMMERPAPPTKSADDLKAILRTMTAKSGAEKEQKKSEHQSSLKGALAEVLEKSKQEAGGRRQEMPKPVAVQPPRPVPEEKKPFEVAEDELRKVLKGEK
ncbi:MAG: type IV secretion system DNA-binding domain-containing protein [Candidatus Pacebacteria bacterium]|nr:type IV secretion system DNA-binding domain-containing protein [Candidatus Paceibacterota bacterium]